MSYSAARPRPLVATMNAALFVVHSAVVPYVFPEWYLPSRHMLPAFCLLSAFVQFGDRAVMLRFHIMYVLVAVLAFAIQMSCIDDGVQSTAWGEAVGCAHHIWAKGLILGLQSGIATLSLAVTYNSREIAGASYGRVTDWANRQK